MQHSLWLQICHFFLFPAAWSWGKPLTQTLSSLFIKQTMFPWCWVEYDKISEAVLSSWMKQNDKWFRHRWSAFDRLIADWNITYSRRKISIFNGVYVSIVSYVQHVGLRCSIFKCNGIRNVCLIIMGGLLMKTEKSALRITGRYD